VQEVELFGDQAGGLAGSICGIELPGQQFEHEQRLGLGLGSEPCLGAGQVGKGGMPGWLGRGQVQPVHSGSFRVML